MAVAETTSDIVEYYRDYTARKGPLRNDPLRNPEVLFQMLAAEASVIAGLHSIDPDPMRARVLDVGCGDGRSLLPLLRLGFNPANLEGVDIRSDQIAIARARYPASCFHCANARALPFQDARFDVVQESMMFLQMTDQEMAANVAQEMIRVTKPGGFLLLLDWRYSKPGSSEFKALDKRRIGELFRVGHLSSILGTFPGALVPPVGRFLSKHSRASYFLVQRLLPFAVGQVTTILVRNLAA